MCVFLNMFWSILLLVRRAGVLIFGGVFVRRGYPIEQLAEHSSHLESAYLLIYGSLPSHNQLKHWETEIARHQVVHADAEEFFRSFRCVSRSRNVRRDPE